MRTLFNTCYGLALAASLLVVVFSKVPPLGRWALMDEYRPESKSGLSHGDLYALCGVDQFRASIPLGPDEGEPTAVDEAKVLLIGDSFTYSRLDSMSFAAMLEALSDIPVANLRARAGRDVGVRPLALLEGSGFTSGSATFAVLLLGERHALRYSGIVHSRRGVSPMRRTVGGIKRAVFDNDVLGAFLRRNRLTGPASQGLRSLRFDLFGRIDNKAVVRYASRPDTLYFRGAAEFSQVSFSPDWIGRLAEGYAVLGQSLRKEYGLELLFVCVPGKYAIYPPSETDGRRYGGFTPSFCEALRQWGVRAVDGYTVLREQAGKAGAGELFYKTDTHFTPLNKRLMVEATAQEMGAISLRSRVGAK